MPLTVDLKMHTVTGQIGIRTNPAQMTVQRSNPQLQVHQIPGAFELNISQASLMINQTACRADAGYRGIGDQLRTFTAEAVGTSMGGIDRRVAEGDALGAIEKGGGASPAEQAFADAISGDAQSFTIDCVPHSPPTIKATVGHVRVAATFARVQTDNAVSLLQVGASTAKVNVYMERQPSLTITVGSAVDTRA